MRFNESSLRTQGPIRRGVSLGQWVRGLFTSSRPVAGSLRSQGRRFTESLMIIPRHADLAGDVVIAGGEFHAGAGGLLADGRAIEFLPRRLVGRIGKATLCFKFGAALLQFLVRDQDIGAGLVEVDPNLVAGLEDRQATVGGGFRGWVQDRRPPR